MTTVAIVGSRGFANLRLVRGFVQLLRPGTIVVSGGASGVDETAVTEAQKCGLEVQIIRPDYAQHGRGAPLIRNGDIIDAADVVYAFWDGKSRGTKDAIDKADRAGVPYVIVAASTGLDALEAELP